MDPGVDVAALDDPDPQAGRLEGDRPRGRELERDRARAAAAALLVDREREGDPEPVEVLARLRPGPAPRAAGDDAALVVDGAEAADDVAVHHRLGRPRRGDRVDVGDERERRLARGADHEAVAPELAADAQHRQRPLRRTAPRSGRRSAPRRPRARGSPTSSASRSRASATAAASRSTALDLLPGADPGLEVVGLDLGDRVGDRARVGRLAVLGRHPGTAAGLTTAKPFWAAIACAGVETK